MRRACCSSPAGVASAPRDAAGDQLVVGPAAPEEERQPRREVETVERDTPVPARTVRRRLLEAEDEVRAREHRLQRRADAGFEVARRSRSVSRTSSGRRRPLA